MDEWGSDGNRSDECRHICTRVIVTLLCEDEDYPCLERFNGVLSPLTEFLSEIGCLLFCNCVDGDGLVDDATGIGEPESLQESRTGFEGCLNLKFGGWGHDDYDGAKCGVKFFTIVFYL